MAAIGSKHKRLYVDFRVNGKRYKEYLSIPDTPANWKKVAVVMKRMEAEITLETFSYRKKYSPESPNADVFDRRCSDRSAKLVSAELFRPFAEKWFALKQIEWRASYEETIRDVLDIYLLPHFGDRAITPEVAGSSPVARPMTQDGGYRNIDFSPFSFFYLI